MRRLKIVTSHRQGQCIGCLRTVYFSAIVCMHQPLLSFTFPCAVELENLVEMKRAEEHRTDAKVGGKENTEYSELQTNQEDHSSMSPVSSPVIPVSSPVSPISSPGDQVQATLSSPPPPKEGGYLLYTIL